MRFAIFTHVLHVKREEQYLAYAPYVREMNIWLKHVEEVEVIAPQPSKRKDNLNDLPYIHSNFTFTKVPFFDLLTVQGFLKAIIRIPIIIGRILAAMKRADHLHLRCPGNIGLLACLCQIFFPGKQKSAKYAGNWDSKSNQQWTYKIQKWILCNPYLTRNMTVLAYSQWKAQTENVLPFFTASFSETEREVVVKEFKSPFKFLFVGSLVKGKQPVMAFKFVRSLIENNIPTELHVYGEGTLKDELEKNFGNKSYIHLHGNQPLDILKRAYKESHFLVLASKSEGWPKAVAEAMYFGCIPIATAVSCVPWMLGSGSRGILITEENSGGNRVESGKWQVESQIIVEITVKKILELIKNSEKMKRMSLEAQKWSQKYTLEKFEGAILKILNKKI